jgi:hypothetical protein
MYASAGKHPACPRLRGLLSPVSSPVSAEYQRAVDIVRKVSPTHEANRSLSSEVEFVANLIRDNAVARVLMASPKQ